MADISVQWFDVHNNSNTEHIVISPGEKLSALIDVVMAMFILLLFYVMTLMMLKCKSLCSCEDHALQAKNSDASRDSLVQNPASHVEITSH